jgi:hypothetical protein
VEVGAEVFLRDGFTARAMVDFVRARIGGNFWLPGGRFEGGANGAGAALSLRSAHIGATLGFANPNTGENTPARFHGDVDLTDAHCAVLDDMDIRPSGSTNASWLGQGAHLRLDGFTYGRLGSRAPKTWPARKAWLDRQPDADRRGREFKPQPFEQLARVLREMGHSAEARSAGLIKQRRVHTSGNLSLASSVFRTLILWPSGYGYRTEYPALAGLVLMLAAMTVFASAYRQGFVTPAQPHAAIAAIGANVATLSGRGPEAGQACLAADLGEAVPPFNAAMFVVDTFVPLVDIDQETSWKPARAPRCDGDVRSLAALDEVNPGWVFNAGPQTGWHAPFTNAVDRAVAYMAPLGGLFVLQWVLLIVGFAISALIAASLSGLIRRD